MARELHPEFQAKMLRELASILDVPIDAVPPVFTRAKPQALKIGVADDLLKEYPEVNIKDLRRWLGIWTGTRQYLHRLRNGLNRHDLDGNDCGLISDDARIVARQRLDRMRKKQKSTTNPSLR